MTRKGPEPRPLWDRFWEKVDVSHPLACWEWTASLKPNGYGQVASGADWPGGHTMLLAHRAVYHLMYGDIPDDLHIDHLCLNKRCVNPDHLEAVTQAENNARAYGAPEYQRRKVECAQGHPFTEDNTYFCNGHRNCRECQREANRRQRSAA